MCYQVCSRLGYWNTILLGNRRRQCGAQASGLTSLSEGVRVFTHQLLFVCWLKAAGGEQRKTLNSPALLAALYFSRADSGGRQSPQAELQEVRLGWHGRHQGRHWQHRLTHVTQTVYFRLAIEHFTVWMSASSRVIARSWRETFHSWQRSWGRRLGIRKGGIEPQESPRIFSSIYPQKNRVCLLYCFVLSPLTLLGAVPHHHLALSVKELTYSSN